MFSRSAVMATKGTTPPSGRRAYASVAFAITCACLGYELGITVERQQLERCNRTTTAAVDALALTVQRLQAERLRP